MKQWPLKVLGLEVSILYSVLAARTGLVNEMLISTHDDEH